MESYGQRPLLAQVSRKLNVLQSSMKFSVRDADASFNDAQFLIDAFDSTIPHLVKTGNSEQWGTEPLSKKKGHVQRDPVRVFIAEVEDDQGSSGSSVNENLARRIDENGNTLLSVGFVQVLDGQFSGYLRTSESLKNHVGPALENGNFVFLQYLVTDHRVGDKRRGAGAVLLQRVKDYAAEKGWKTIWLDCWDGGNRQLVQYYVDRGFQIMGSFQDTDDKDEVPWKGKLLRIDLA
ncbi:hypothetical protein FLONG3_10128 [Fusarium longipes]|uniref:N-acetyltransferase domain-containing protein n=1 Tax=Fusarium longipes TaxID=694270 RepID=A0A395RRP2_9HYPO|nr:hypothetical protein FLONG3_10128 [Fusarium longipes]